MGICAKRSMKERGVSLMLGGVLAFKQFELQPYELKTEIGLFFGSLSIDVKTTTKTVLYVISHLCLHFFHVG